MVLSINVIKDTELQDAADSVLFDSEIFDEEQNIPYYSTARNPYISTALPYPFFVLCCDYRQVHPPYNCCCFLKAETDRASTSERLPFMLSSENQRPLRSVLLQKSINKWNSTK